MSAQPAKLGVWGDAVCAALTGDRRELVELLRHHNKPPDDVLEFLAWLLDERKNGRPSSIDPARARMRSACGGAGGRELVSG
jgi:hypothetical protein